MKKIPTLLLVFATFIFACNSSSENQNDETADSTKSEIANLSKSEHLVMATVWFQQSAEMKAIYYQTFNIAKKLLDEKIANPQSDLPQAVVVDVDETMLDNSPFEAKLIEDGETYTAENWKAWTDQARAKAVPGAVDFAKYAEEKGVEVFYISNRKVDEVQTSIVNLTNEGFPFVDEKHILFKSETSDKTARRAIVAENYDIVLLIGDNLGDFDQLFNERETDKGFSHVEKHKDMFGDKFLILPNPMYGEWEKAVYNGDYSISNEEKSKLRKQVLEK